MDTFEFISVALSFVLGLGVTHLLSSAVRVFVARKRMRIDWIPLVWAFCVFATLIQYWWAIFELSELEEWPLSHFLFFLGMALLLFVAGALVLPSWLLGESDDLGDLFEEHGRWGLVCLSAYFLMVQGGNAAFFGASPFSPLGLQVWVLVVLPLVVLVAQRRSVQGLATLVYLFLLLFTAYQASPPAY